MENFDAPAVLIFVLGIVLAGLASYVGFYTGRASKEQEIQAVADELLVGEEHTEAFRSCLLDRWRNGGILE